MIYIIAYYILQYYIFYIQYNDDIIAHFTTYCIFCCCFSVGHGVFNYLRSRISLCVASASARLSLSVLKALLPVSYSIPTMTPCHLAF